MAKKFIEACKNNEIMVVMQLIKLNKYLVYEFDHIKMTGLHWACKRNYNQMARLLIEFHSDMEAQDLVKKQKK